MGGTNYNTAGQDRFEEPKAKYSKTIYWSLQNNGDGSASPKFFDSEALAEFDQDNMDEGWREPCTGDITIESESPIIIKGIDVIDKAAYIEELESQTTWDTSDELQKKIMKAKAL